MAQGNITLRIGSVFNGEGLQRLQNGVKQANQAVGKGIGVANTLSASFAAVDSSASRCASAAGNLVQAFAQGGVAGAAFTAVTMVINAKLKDMQAELEATKKEAADLEAKLSKGFSEGLAKRIGDAISNAKALGAEFERVAKHAESVQAAMAGLNAAQVAGGIARLETERLNATLAATDDAMKQMIAAAYDVKIAEAKLAAVEEQGAAKVEAARSAYLTNQERVANIGNRIAEIDKSIATQKKFAASIAQADAAKSREVMASVSKLEAERATLIAAQKVATDNSTVLEIKWQTACEENRTAIAAQTNAVTQATAAERKLAEAKEIAAMNERNDAALAVGDMIQAATQKEWQARLSDAASTEADARKEAAAAASAVAAAEKRLQSAVEAYNANITQNMANEVVTNAAWKAVATNGLSNTRGELLKAIPGIAKAAGDVAVEQALKDGRIRTVDDLTKVRNAAERQSRIDASKNFDAEGRDAERAARLSKMSDKAMSKADKDWLDKYKKVDEANKKAALDKVNAEAEKIAAKQRQEKADQAVQKAADELSQIRAKLDNLGLK